MASVGEIRPSQLMFSYGIGAVFDLPEISVMLMGLDSWDKTQCKTILEPRLLSAVHHFPGCHGVRELCLPPSRLGDDTQDNLQGVPVAPFPQWLRCTRCGFMSPLDSGRFKLENHHGKPKGFYHDLCPSRVRNPRALPVRFVLACEDGHLQDVPWNEFVHDGHPCAAPTLYINEFGVTGNASDIIVRCTNCNARKSIAALFGKLKGEQPAFVCEGLHPHIRQRQDGCNSPLSLVALGASNLWFPQSISVLSMPDRTSEIENIVRENWQKAKDITSPDILKFVTLPDNILPQLGKFPPDEVLAVINKCREAMQAPEEDGGSDVKLPEWQVLSGISPLDNSRVMEIEMVEAPENFENYFEKTTLVHRLTEVRAMYGFTRISTQQELDLGIVTQQKIAPLTRGNPTWLPASESHGEGIFIHFKENMLATWENLPPVADYNQKFLEAHMAWRKSRKFTELREGYPGMRFVLLHSFSHALMQEIVLDCGYTAASIRERIYCRTKDMPGGPMSGVLLYTASSDSEGTLGGLVSLGRPNRLGRYIAQALEKSRLCSGDPLCADLVPEADGRVIHGASCHSCLFSPETSCECGNRYLDRKALVETLASEYEIAFFGAV